MRADLPRGTVTLLFTDIEGSTRLLHSLGPDAYGDALAEHRRVLRDAFVAHGGVEVDTQGDAFFVAFPTAPRAAAAALAANEALAAGPISVRMGLHTGVPLQTSEGYVGIDVHRGARVAALAHGGQVVISPATAALLDGETLLDLGLHRLKDFGGATRLHQLGDTTHPPLRTPGSIDLPTPATRFLGRERELFEAVSLVYERDPRALTILGPGGTGKTRFALELARLLAEDAEGGTVFCALAPLRDADLLLPTIADRLGAGSADVGAIAARVGDRRTHVVCDNLEHLLPDAARPLAELTAAAPGLRLLTTSREPVRIQGESELDLPPLAGAEAIALFMERAHAVRPDLALDEHVTELCARLDHLPLAVELAAARTKLLAPEVLLERIDRRLDLLKGTRDADERHSTLRATIAWSYDLLDEDEQRLFRQLAVFRGGSTLETAEAVCDADLDVLASLLDKSLVRRRTGRLEEERFWMLETIREFAAERLEESIDANATRRRHAERMLAIASSAHLNEDDDEPFGLPVVLAERDDMYVALDWAADNDIELAVELLVSLEHFWNTQSPEDALRRVDRLLSTVSQVPPALRARALRVRGGALHISGHLDSCDAAYDESLALFRAIEDERGIVAVTHRLANSAYQRGEHERARELAGESLELSRGRFPFVDVPNNTVLGRVLVAMGDVDAGTELLRQSARISADLGWDWWRGGILAYLAFLAIDRGDLDEAERVSLEVLLIDRQEENRPAAFLPLTTLARVALERKDRRRAGLLWGALEAERERASNQAWEHVRVERSGPLLDETSRTFLAGVEDGCQLDFWDAVGVALGELELPQIEP